MNILGISEPGNFSNLVWRWLLLWPTPHPRREGWLLEGAGIVCHTAKKAARRLCCVLDNQM